ncbi:MAG: hypothetical protein WKF91_17260, partial [Segetibacter sp.]
SMDKDLSAVFAGKLIEDNLPDLHYKKLIAAFKKYVIPALLLTALGYYGILAKISRDREVQKIYMILTGWQKRGKKILSKVYKAYSK